MRYCADTWFLLELFSKNPQALLLIDDVRKGKTRIAVPIVVFAEATKKLLQRGNSQNAIDTFFGHIEASEKIALVPLDKTIAEEAARISFSHGVPLVDSFVAATAKITGCDALLTADADYAVLSKRKYLKVQSW